MPLFKRICCPEKDHNSQQVETKKHIDLIVQKQKLQRMKHIWQIEETDRIIVGQISKNSRESVYSTYIHIIPSTSITESKKTCGAQTKLFGIGVSTATNNRSDTSISRTNLLKHL